MVISLPPFITLSLQKPQMNKPNSPMAAESPFRSPASHLENLSPSYSPPHPDLPSPASIVSWSARAAAAESHPPLPSVDTKAALPSPPHQDGGSRSVASIVRRNRAAATLKKAAIVARVSSAILCLISFSVMAADKNKGWTLDSFDHYNEYRYCLSVNVIGFVYAGFQAFAGVHHMVHERHIIERPMGYYFDFAMDQILAYLLISASSSATSRTDYWVTNWGTDPFPNMISGSVAISFLAFMAFAISSLISAYNLFSSRSNV